VIWSVCSVMCDGRVGCAHKARMSGNPPPLKALRQTWTDFLRQQGWSGSGQAHVHYRYTRKGRQHWWRRLMYFLRSFPRWRIQVQKITYFGHLAPRRNRSRRNRSATR
jgi:hypothetical protein